MSNQFSFDDEETDFSGGVTDVLKSIDPEDQTLELEDDELMTDVSLRLEIASYYKLLLDDSLFDDKTQASEIVEGHIRSFARYRLEVLVGIKQENSKKALSDIFTEEQLEALKAIANRVLDHPDVTVKTEPQTESKPPAIVSRAVKPAAPGPKPIRKKRKQRPGKKPVVEAKPKQSEMVEGNVIEKNGKKYKLVTNSAGELYMKDLTPSYRGASQPGIVPMPQGAMFTQVMEFEAMNTASKFGAIPAAISQILTKP